MINNIKNRQMPVFLSSTFRDMQEERDVLIKNIFPKLRNLAEQRLVTLTPIDLRWGITEDESKTGKVIELCLQEIERCQPFFIGILGNHYGWCPSVSDMKENTMLLDQYQWLQKDLEEGLSITEIEMQFAVLRKQHHANAFFFIRRSVTDQEQRDSKLNKLINNIQSKGQDFLTAELTPDTDSQCYYAYYDTPEELGRLVEDALVSLLDALFPLGSDEDEWIRESRAQQAFLQNLNDIYVPMANNEFITYFMNQMTERYMMISSDKKCFYGKSAFVANWLKEHQNDHTHNYIYHSVGVGFLGGNYKKILKRLCLEVAKLYELPLPEDNENGHEIDFSYVLTGLLEEIQDQKPLYIIIDGLQHLSDYDEAKMLNWLPVVPDNVSLIVTAPYHDPTQEVFYRRHNSVFRLEAFVQDKERLFVEKYLGKFGKRLSPHQIDTILQAYSLADFSPKGVKDILTLKSLLNELVVFGSYELLDKQIAYYCEDNLALFYPRMFERMENDYGLEIVKNILCFIAYSRAGLSEPEILDISGAAIMQWSNIHYAISHLLTFRNGKYYIDKMTINSQIVKRYGKDEKTIRQKLVNHFKQISDDRAIEECLFQYYQLQDYDALYKTILNIDVFYHLYQNSGLSELLPYWKALYDSNKKKYCIDSYVKLQVSVTEEYAHVFSDIGQFAKQVLGDPNAAETLFTKSKDIYESILHTDYDTLANVYQELGIYDKALENIDKLLPLAKNFFSERDTFYSEMLLSKGAILLKMGQRRQAVEIWREALDEVLHDVGEISIMASALYRNLAGAYFFLKDDDCFKEYIEKSIVVIGKTVGEDHIYMGDSFYLYGVFHEQAHHSVEALDFYRKALVIYKKWYPGNHDKVLETEERIKKLQSTKGGSLMDSIINSMCANLPDWLVDTQEEYPLSESDFQDVLNFFEGIADDLYLVDEGWEDGMKEYVYKFRYKHDCYIGGDRYVYGPNSHNVYIYMDSDGRYNSCGKSFDNLKDAQVHYLVRWYSFYEQYCHYKNI